MILEKSFLSGLQFNYLAKSVLHLLCERVHRNLVRTFLFVVISHNRCNSHYVTSTQVTHRLQI